MRLLVTGGNGFIGSHVVLSALADGHTVAVVDDLSSGKARDLPEQVQVVVGDVCDPATVRQVLVPGTECVLHLAAQIDVRHAMREPLRDAGVNILGTLNILQACAESGTSRILFSSTGGALYGQPEPPLADELAPVMPLSPYGVSKYCAEQYVGYFSRMFGLQTTILRYANVYGPGQDPYGEAGVVSIFARQILLREPCVIYGDGEQTRDFVYVDDVAHANMLALGAPPGIFNVGSGREVSVNELLSAFERVLGRRVERTYMAPRLGEVRRVALDARKASRELGWQPQVSLDDGLARTLQWVQETL